MLKRFSIVFTIAVMALATLPGGTVTVRQVATKEFLDSSGSGPIMTVRPYIQNMTTSAVSILWETSVPATGVVKVSGPGVDETCHTTAAGRLTEVRLDGLAPDTTYSYSVSVDGSGQARGVEASFKTFPAAPRAVKFLVYGDDRSFPGRHLTVVNGMSAELVWPTIVAACGPVAPGLATAMPNPASFSVPPKKVAYFLAEPV